MLTDYHDIISRISEPPLWYDERGVPRYEYFNPYLTGVYTKQAILAEVGCQHCRRTFLIGEGWDGYDWNEDVPEKTTLDERVSRWGFGDPPRHGCIGDTMSAYEIRILEAWEQLPMKERLERWARKNEGEDVGSLDWMRRPDLEISIIPPWWADGSG